MPHLFSLTLLDIIIILSITGGLFAFATWGLRGDDEVNVHPEMKDVKDGEKLMGVTSQQKTSCDLEEYKTLQARIEKIREQLEEDDDEGGLVVRK